jgi:hypothetical protein
VNFIEAKEISVNRVCAICEKKIGKEASCRKTETPTSKGSDLS